MCRSYEISPKSIRWESYHADMTRPVVTVILFANAPKRLKCQSYAVHLDETSNSVEILVVNDRVEDPTLNTCE